MAKYLVIPDCQTKPGVDISYLNWVGNYIAAKRPDVIVQIGDFVDMSSLSSFDVGKRSFEGRRYKDDIATGVKAMELLTKPFKKLKSYKPKMVLTLGNHEDRITRATQSDAKLEGTITLDDLKYKEFG